MTTTAHTITASQVIVGDRIVPYRGASRLVSHVERYSDKGRVWLVIGSDPVAVFDSDHIVTVERDPFTVPTPRKSCVECGRVFDLTNATDCDELAYGHDCES